MVDKLTIGVGAVVAVIIIFIGVLVILLGYVGYTTIAPAPKPAPPDTSIAAGGGIPPGTAAVVINSSTNGSNGGTSEELPEDDTTEEEGGADEEEEEEEDTTPKASCKYPSAVHGSTICGAKDASNTQLQYIWECVDGTWAYTEDCGSVAKCDSSTVNRAKCV